jgi:hypothetical protein
MAENETREESMAIKVDQWGAETAGLRALRSIPDYPVAAVRAVNAVPAIVAAAPSIVSGAEAPPLNSGDVVTGLR